MEHDRGRLPYVSHNLPSLKGGFLRRFALETGMVNKGITVVYQRVRRFNSKGIRKKCNMNSKWLFFFVAVLISLMMT